MGQLKRQVGNTHSSGDCLKLHRNSSFLLSQEKAFKGFKTFSKSKDACPFSFNFQSRWKRGRSAALPAAAAAFVRVQEGEEFEVAATAFSGTPGALVVSASGGIAIDFGEHW